MAARRKRKRSKAAQAPSLILDSGAIIGLARKDARARAFLARALEAGVEVHVSAVVVAESVRGHGPNDRDVNRVFEAIDSVLPIDERTARAAGGLLGQARSGKTVDALVVASAIQAGGGRILTGDRSEALRPLAKGRKKIAIHAL